MSELICCRRCDEPTCRGCNLYALESALTLGRFDGLMDAHHEVRINADVVERKAGRWMPSTVIIPVKNTDGTFSNFGTLVCSSCNKPVALVVWNNFCPNCGADMRPEQRKEDSNV